MARRNFLDRAREFVGGISRQIGERISDLFGGSADREITHIEIPDPVVGLAVDSENLTEIEEIQTQIDEFIVTEPEENEMLPEPIFGLDDGNPDEEFESEFEFQQTSFGSFRSSDLRRVVATFEEALNYARQIPIPANGIIIVLDPNNGLFRVVVEYES